MQLDPILLNAQSPVFQQVVYLMGTSFILGSLITILLLMIVDLVHRRLTDD